MTDDTCRECCEDRLVESLDEETSRVVLTCFGCGHVTDPESMACTPRPKHLIGPSDYVRQPTDEVLDHCEHDGENVVTRDGDVVCRGCGMVLARGLDLFHFGAQRDGAYHYRKGTYKIKYYINEKIAQLLRQCPPPSAEVFDRFLQEASDERRRNPGSSFARKTIAKICRKIGVPTLQEKWLMLLEMLKSADPVGFADIRVPPKPSPRLVNEIRRLFHLSLPAWQMCKDRDISQDLARLKDKKNVVYRYHQRRRKSYPHNFMIREFLRQIQDWNEEGKQQNEEEMRTCFDLYEPCVKRVSKGIEQELQIIYSDMVRCMNDIQM